MAQKPSRLFVLVGLSLGLVTLYIYDYLDAEVKRRMRRPNVWDWEPADAVEAPR